MGPGCELSTGLLLSIGAGAVGVLCVSCIVGLIVTLRVKVQTQNFNKAEILPMPLVPEKPRLNAASRVSDVISFKEEGLQEIRIKLL
jgi:hypothetical protein